MAHLNELEKETIAEVGNISLGASATALAIILNRKVEITTPRLQELSLKEIRQSCPEPCLAVEVSYTIGLKGSNMLLVKEEDAVVIAAVMMGEDHEGKTGPLSEIELSAVQEAMNQMMGSMATSMSELFSRTIDISSPQLDRIDQEGKIDTFSDHEDEDLFVRVEFDVSVEEIINSTMVQVIPAEFAKEMAAQLLQEVSGSAPALEEVLAPGPAEEEAAVKTGLNAVEEAIVAPQEQQEELLTSIEQDTLSEVGNISLGASATALSLLLGRGVEISTPKIEIVQARDIKKKYPIPCLLIEVDYVEGLKGSNVLLLKEDDALVIASLMMGEEPAAKKGEITELELSAVQEAMNQMMGSMATSMSELFLRAINISPPRVELINLAEEKELPGQMDLEDYVVHTEFSIVVEGVLDSVMAQVIPLDFAREMTGYLLNPPELEAEATGPATEEVGPQEGLGPVAMPDAEDFGDRRAFAPDTPEEESAAYYVPPAPAPAPRAEAMSMPPGMDLEKLDLVRDVPMDITVVLGTTRLPLGDLFALDRGGIVELDCHAGDPVQVLTGDRLLALGEIVIIGDQVGVRIMQIQFEEVLDQYSF